MVFRQGTRRKPSLWNAQKTIALERGRWSSVSLMIYMNFMCIAYRTASRTFFVLYIIYITYIYHIYNIYILYIIYINFISIACIININVINLNFINITPKQTLLRIRTPKQETSKNHSSWKFLSAWCKETIPKLHLFLVGGLEDEFYFPICWEYKIIPTNEFHHFSEGWLNHQPATYIPSGYST